jgi:hypothetical protein
LVRTFLLISAWVLAALAIADLVLATTAGETLVFGPVIGAILGWLASKKGASRKASRLAIGVNATVLILTVIAIFTFGGT